MDRKLGIGGCQGCNLQLTGTRSLVVGSGVGGCFMPLGAKIDIVMIRTTDLMVKRIQRRGAK